MARLVALAAAVVVVAATAGAAELSEEQKIEALIKSVDELKGAKFIRNGSAHDGKAAAQHMRRKWKAGDKQIRTARDFIRLAASASSKSGKPYLIRFKDGREVESGAYLAEKLDEIEKGAEGKG